jgi:hypothetical protein
LFSVRPARADKPIVKRNFPLSDYNIPKQQNDRLYQQQQINLNLNSPLSKDSKYTIGDCIDKNSFPLNSGYIVDNKNIISNSLQDAELAKEKCYKGERGYSD